jgi:hypothetical protein
MDSEIRKNGKGGVVIWAEANYVLSLLQTVDGAVCAGQVTRFILKLNATKG